MILKLHLKKGMGIGVVRIGSTLPEPTLLIAF